MITLRLVDETTFEAVIGLSVADGDKRRAASNLYSLAQAWLYRQDDTIEPLAILASGKVVGFLLLAKHRRDKEYLIWRLMIDQAHQNRGHGREVLRQVIQMAKDDQECQKVTANYVIGNHKMRGLLEKFAFQPVGLKGNEMMMTLDIK